MELSDKIAFAAFFVSLTAGAVAFAALWRSHLARFRPITIVGNLRHRIYTFESENKRWYVSSFDAPISVTNAGARVGHVVGLRLRLEFPDLPIPENYELLPAKFEIPPSEARRINADRLNWLDELPITNWLPFAVLPGASTTKQFIFETRWDEPVVQPRMLATLEMRSSRNVQWQTIGEFVTPLGHGVWAEMAHGGSAFTSAPIGAVEQEEEINPPDLHKYTGSKNEISPDGIASASRLVPPKR